LIHAESYLSGRPIVVIEQRAGVNPGAWARLESSLARGVVGGSKTRMDVRVDVFLDELASIREVRFLFGEEFDWGPTLKAQLQSVAADRRAREAVASTSDVYDLSALKAELLASGFKRELRGFQLDNLARIVHLPHGADFSVPGAGKTSVALAGFALARARKQVKRLVVVGPLAAFQAWKDEVAECLVAPPPLFVHGGPGTYLPDSAEILLTNYNRVSSDYDRIRAFVAAQPAHVILDEAHRIKRGADGAHGRAVLDLAYAARRRDVLTGTPAPQGAFDLIALMRFLYPGQDRQILPASAYLERDGREEGVVREVGSAISRYFVRTPKSKLGLPHPIFQVVKEPMAPIQAALYEALLGRYRGSLALETASRREFDRLGRIVMYLLEAATNPMLLVAGSDVGDEVGFEHPPLDPADGAALADLLGNYRSYETPWKYKRIVAIVTDAASRGEKVLVWSSFVRNIRLLAHELSHFQPATVHGGIPPVDSAPPGAVTREAELERFRNDPSCVVLLANPAACGEGVSLHHWCHHAVYLDRTFNAGHFLQSQDRIHRLGLDTNAVTKFTLLLSEGSIDETVDARLRDKVVALSRLMDDTGLVRAALPEADEGMPEAPAFADDTEAILSHLRLVGTDAT
jgi:hypothetical protein